MNESMAHHGAESPGIADVSKMENKVNVSTIHLLEDHVSGVEGVWLDVVEEKEASIFLSTTHIYREKCQLLIIIKVIISQTSKSNDISGDIFFVRWSSFE